MRGMVAQLVLMVVIIQLYSNTAIQQSRAEQNIVVEDKKLYHGGESLIILGVILSNVSPGLAGLTGTLLTLTLARQQ